MKESGDHLILADASGWSVEEVLREVLRAVTVKSRA